MRSALILSTLCAAALAAPITQIIQSRADTKSTWQPAQGSTSSCDKTSDKIIGFYVGPQMEDVLTNACAAMMPPCAYPDRLPKDTVCAQVVDWRLDGPQTSTQSANVETAEGNKISGWDVKLSVTPAAQPETSAGVFWTAQDCYGYFAYMLEKWEPEGCHTQQGFGIGNITVGGDSSLAGTVFKVEIVSEK
ncbi:hypothetical protein E8E12_008402 [Didymella heteroderae]|uniref:Uncharacterized protein n=1 Tax=Didymella heteroderae TaxID=1769908 RepID=A0A9P4WTC8_9PLEO|nr:hypothetical protein E8E12_008402 [Didymella heteroderae]